MLEYKKEGDIIIVQLPEDVTIVQVEEDHQCLKKIIFENQGKSPYIQIDVSKVSQIDTAYLQLLLSFCISSNDVYQCVIKGESNAFTEISTLYGFDLTVNPKQPNVEEQTCPK